MEQTCGTEGCKANLSHRLGIHSWWCPNWRPIDAMLRPLVYNGGKYPDLGIKVRGR